MQTPEDERFEKYLQQFRPLVPDALPEERERALPRKLVLAIWSAAAAAVVILGVISLQLILNRVPAPHNQQSVSVNSPLPPLTMRDANSLLTKATSYKAALNEMAFNPQHSAVPSNKQSAIAILAKEKIRL